MFLVLLGGCIPFNELVALATGDPQTDDWEGDTAVEGVDDAPGAGFPFAEGVIFDIDIELPPASVDGLERNGPYVPGVLRFAGLEAPVGVRLKGSSTFDNLDGDPSFKLNFSAFAPGATFLGLERLTLNAMKFDHTMMREAAAYHLFAEVGVPGPRHGYGTVTVNGTFYGLYSLIETLDENFLRRAYPGDDDGYLYDSTFVAADLTGFGLPNFELQEGDPATAYTDLESLLGALDSGNILDVLDTRFDPSVFTYLATDLVTPNWDGYTRNTNNFLLYHATLADRWYFVPWGQDTAFRGGGGLYMGVRGRVATACLGDAACRARLEETCRTVLATWEESDLVGWATALAEVVRPACAADPNGGDDCEVDEILEVLANRPAEVRRDQGW